jgi:hypothetical protein
LGERREAAANNPKAMFRPLIPSPFFDAKSNATDSREQQKTGAGLTL